MAFAAHYDPYYAGRANQSDDDVEPDEPDVPQRYYGYDAAVGRQTVHRDAVGDGVQYVVRSVVNSFYGH